MPCNDGGYTDAQLKQMVRRSLAQKKRKREKRKQEIQYALNLEAMLCSILTSVSKLYGDLAILKLNDEKRSGIPTKDIVKWFSEHQKKDAEKKLRTGK